MKTFVFSEDISLLAELVGRGKQYGDVCAVVVGSEADAKAAAACGADVMWIAKDESALIDDYIGAVITLIKEEAPQLFLVGATVYGKMLAARVAAALDTLAVPGVKELDVSDGITVTQMIYGGGAVRKMKLNGATAVIIARHGFGEKLAAPEAGVVHIVMAEKAAAGLGLSESKEKAVGNDGILTAKKVIGVGNAFESNEHINIARELAAALGAEVGYTRPLIEGDPPVVPNEPYIGVSGIQLKPDLYLAIGVSGQTQHIVGVNESKVVACINNDQNALIFRHSDYGILGDLNEVVPALTKAINNLK